MLLQRFGAGKATARRQGPAQSSVRCRASGQTEKDVAKVDAREEPSKGLGRAAVSAALAATLVVSGAGQQPPTALAELNAREYDRGGEFNRGSAKQFGGVDMIKVDIVKEFGEDLRLSNFVQADIRNAKLRKANLRGAYMMKLVAPGVDFTGADMSDALMDRSVFVKANFTDAILARVVLTLSDLNDAVIGESVVFPSHALCPCLCFSLCLRS